MLELIFLLALEKVYVVAGWEGFLTPGTFGRNPLVFSLRICYWFTGFVFYRLVVLEALTVLVVNCLCISLAGLHRPKYVLVGGRSRSDEFVFSSRFSLKHSHWLFIILFPLVQKMNQMRVYFLQNLWNSLAEYVTSTLPEEPWLTIVILMVAVHNVWNKLHLERNVGENEHQGFQVVNLWLFVFRTVPECFLAKLVFFVGFESELGCSSEVSDGE